jgi:hypothetical protein
MTVNRLRSVGDNLLSSRTGFPARFGSLSLPVLASLSFPDPVCCSIHPQTSYLIMHSSMFADITLVDLDFERS